MHWKNRAEYVVFRGAVGSLARMPDRWSDWLCRRAGWLAGPILGIRRQVVHRQMASVYTQRSAPEIRQLSAQVYDHLGRTLAEVFCSDPERLRAQVDVVPGWAALDEAMAAGRGVLAVTVHLGNFELGGRILAQRYRVLDVVKPMRNPHFDSYLQRSRANHGIATVPMTAAGKTVLAHLRGGGLVTLFVDQDAGRDGVRTDFLGLPASTWPGAARLALRTGCPVVPLAIVRNPDGRHVLHIGESLAAGEEAASEEGIAAFTARITAAVESFIRERPEQWFWVHRRWKGAAEAKKVS